MGSSRSSGGHGDALLDTVFGRRDDGDGPGCDRPNDGEGTPEERRTGRTREGGLSLRVDAGEALEGTGPFDRHRHRSIHRRPHGSLVVDQRELDEGEVRGAGLDLVTVDAGAKLDRPGRGPEARAADLASVAPGNGFDVTRLVGRVEGRPEPVRRTRWPGPYHHPVDAQLDVIGVGVDVDGDGLALVSGPGPGGDDIVERP